MHKVMLCYGTRPEAVKISPLWTELTHRKEIQPLVVVTAQHREMLDQVNQTFGIEPDVDLDLMEQGQTLNEIAARVAEALDDHLQCEQPELVVVQGDTTTAATAAFAAFNRSIPVVHLEAGLRTGDLKVPFPEEGNRRIITAISSLHLAPTDSAKANLMNEGVPGADIAVTGNTVIDALQVALQRKPEFADPPVARLLGSSNPLVLVTMHRRESWGSAMEGVCQALNELAARHPRVSFLLPLHRNPRVRDVFARGLQHRRNVVLTSPLEYVQFAHALSACSFVLTDSGGIQEEAPSLGKPVLVMRGETERPEGIAAGTARLIGTDPASIAHWVDRLLKGDRTYRRMANAVNPYGDGRAAARCASAIAHLLGLGARLPDFGPGGEVGNQLPKSESAS